MTDEAASQFIITHNALPPCSTNQKKRVLTEEEYVNGIEAIIERDFFPDIPILKSRLERMKKRGAQGPYSRYAGDLFTTSHAFVVSDVPTPAVGGNSGVMETPIVASEIDRKQSMEIPKSPSQPDVSSRVSLDVFLSQVTSEDNASFEEIHREAMQRKKLKVSHLLEFPKAETSTVAGYIDWKFDPKNKLFYDSSTTGEIPYTEKELAARVQGPPKVIKHENSRLPADFDPESIVAALKPVQDYCIPGEKGNEPRPLLLTPTPVPGKNMTPIMTWGELAATPIRLDRTPGFTITAASERDVIGRKMARSARRSLQKRSARFTPASVRATPNTLSSAGRKLISAIKKTPGTDLQLRASYAGTPRQRSSRRHASISRPKIKKEPTHDPNSKITDNLLD